MGMHGSDNEIFGSSNRIKDSILNKVNKSVTDKSKNFNIK